MHYFFLVSESCFLPSLLIKGSMFSAVVLVLGCVLQRRLVTTEGHRGTNRHEFYAVQMDGGIRAARALAEQQGLEFIQRVSACLKPLFLPLPTGLQFTFSKSGYSRPFFESCQSADFCFLFEGYLTFIKLQQRFWIFHIWSKTYGAGRPHSDTHIYERPHTCTQQGTHMHIYTHSYLAHLSLRLWETPICGIGSSWMSLEMIGSLPICLGFNLSCWIRSICQKTRCDLSTSIL